MTLITGPKSLTRGDLIQTIADAGAIAAEPALSGNVWDTNYSTALVNQFTSTATLLTSTSFSPFQPGLAVLGDVPNEAPLPTPDNQDYYSLSSPQANQRRPWSRASTARPQQISIVDGNGNVLATGVSGATNVSQSIENFVAPADWHLLRRSYRRPGPQYSVRHPWRTFTIQPHNSISTAENVTGTGGVLGYLAPPTSPLLCWMTSSTELQPHLPDRSGHGRLHRSRDRRPRRSAQ